MFALDLAVDRSYSSWRDTASVRVLVFVDTRCSMLFIKQSRVEWNPHRTYALGRFVFLDSCILPVVVLLLYSNAAVHACMYTTGWDNGSP